MSSHHFVRDGQEPALIFLDLNDVLWSISGHLLEWSPFIMASHSAADYLNMEGIYIDHLLTESKIMNCTDEVVNESLIGFLKEKNQYAATLVCFSNQISKLPKTFEGFKISYVTEDFRQLFIENASFSKWFSAGKSIEIIDSLTGKARKKTFVFDEFFTLEEGSNKSWLREFF